jgi:hypothetical protein
VHRGIFIVVDYVYFESKDDYKKNLEYWIILEKMKLQNALTGTRIFLPFRSNSKPGLPRTKHHWPSISGVSVNDPVSKIMRDTLKTIIPCSQTVDK